MQIAILGSRRNLRDEVERQVRACLAEGSPLILRQYGMDEPRYNAAPAELAAAFVIIDDAKALDSLRTVAGWGENLPLTIVSNHPQYALEGVRLQARHYLLLPLEQRDVREALLRMGLEVKPSG